MLNFYRLLRDAAGIKAVLYDLATVEFKEDISPIQWNQDTSATFHKCKYLLASAALLAHPAVDGRLF